MAIHQSITFDRVQQAVEDDDNLGFCIACGDDALGVEPDARRYPCEGCGAMKVYGAQELFIRFASGALAN